MEPGLLESHLQQLWLVAFLEAENCLVGLFTTWKLSLGRGSCPDAPPPHHTFIPVHIRPHLNPYILAQAFAPTLTFSYIMFCIFSCPAYTFAVDLLKSSDHVTALGCLEISSAKEISPLLF